MVSPPSKKGWLKAGVVGINKVYPSIKKGDSFFYLPPPLRGLWRKEVVDSHASAMRPKYWMGIGR
jgi:hypothetical protein